MDGAPAASGFCRQRLPRRVELRADAQQEQGVAGLELLVGVWVDDVRPVAPDAHDARSGLRAEPQLADQPSLGGRAVAERETLQHGPGERERGWRGLVRRLVGV